MHKSLLTLLILLVGSVTGFAQADEKPANAAGVRITFLPPPIEGTLSIGVYNSAGKIIRILKTEATEKDFTVGLNGFITTWDGRDDAGVALPAGNYAIRGYAVGHLDIDGVAYHGNEWITDEESLEIARMTKGGAILPNGDVRISVELKDGSSGAVIVPLGPQAAKPRLEKTTATSAPAVPASSELPKGAEAFSADEGRTLAYGNGKVWKRDGASWQELPLKDVEQPIHVALAGNSVWLIDAANEGVQVQQCSFAGESLRSLPIPAGEPTPKWIAAHGDDTILLWEEGPKLQRIRVLQRESGTGAESEGERRISNWRTLLSRTVRDTSTFAAMAGYLGRPTPFQPEPKISIRLLPNPLLKDAATNVSLEIATDKAGSILRTLDGLPLVRLTEATDLKWAVMGRENGSKALSIFQSDGTVVEEFRASKLANMMAFDAGEYEWKGK